jgi:hypothetical protein
MKKTAFSGTTTLTPRQQQSPCIVHPIGCSARHHLVCASWTPFDHRGGDPDTEPTTAQRLVTCQSGIPACSRPLPDCPEEEYCKECHGTGTAVCRVCHGKGRLNKMRAPAITESGAWPVWCKSCYCKGFSICGACLGTGIKREPIGFRVP